MSESVRDQLHLETDRSVVMKAAMRFAYADPPYPGKSRKHYKDHPDYGGEVDHAALIEMLMREFPDGWALSTNSTVLKDLLPLCPEDIRIGAWVKPFAVFKPHVSVTYGWEPVLFRGGRKRQKGERTPADWVKANITMGQGTVGAKPEQFCYWLFNILNIQEGDDLIDLFPGSGAIGRYLEIWKRQPALFTV